MCNLVCFNFIFSAPRFTLSKLKARKEPWFDMREGFKKRVCFYYSLGLFLTEKKKQSRYEKQNETGLMILQNIVALVKYYRTTE